MGIAGFLKKIGGRTREKEKALTAAQCLDDDLNEFNLCPPEEIYIKSLPLITLSDVQKVVTELKAGNIVILHIKPMLQRDKTRNELKRAVDQLRGVCRQIEGDIAQLGGEYIIITPGPFVRIYKPEPRKVEEKEESEAKEEAKEEASSSPIVSGRRPYSFEHAKLGAGRETQPDQAVLATTRSSTFGNF